MWLVGKGQPFCTGVNDYLNTGGVISQGDDHHTPTASLHEHDSSTRNYDGSADRLTAADYSSADHYSGARAAGARPVLFQRQPWPYGPGDQWRHRYLHHR